MQSWKITPKHPVIEETGPTLEQTMKKISDFILNKQHNFCNHMDDKLKDAMIDTIAATSDISKKFFNKDSTAMKEISNQALTDVCILIKTKQELKTYSADHYQTAKRNTATSIANNVYTMLEENKKVLITYIVNPTRAKQTDMLTLLIRSINLNINWCPS